MGVRGSKWETERYIGQRRDELLERVGRMAGGGMNPKEDALWGILWPRPVVIPAGIAPIAHKKRTGRRYLGSDGVCHVRSSKWFLRGAAMCGAEVLDPTESPNAKPAGQHVPECTNCRAILIEKYGLGKPADPRNMGAK